MSHAKVGPKVRFTDKWHLQHRAWRSVKYAIDTGKIQPPSFFKCADCKTPASEYDHFLGYAPENFLNVQPVCKSCHNRRAFDRQERPAARFDNHKRRGSFGPLLKDKHFYSPFARGQGGK